MCTKNVYNKPQILNKHKSRTKHKSSFYSIYSTRRGDKFSFHQHLLSADLLREKKHGYKTRWISFSGTCDSSTITIPLHVVTGTYVTRVYSLLGESSSSLRFLDRRTRILYGTFLHNNRYNHGLWI